MDRVIGQTGFQSGFEHDTGCFGNAFCGRRMRRKNDRVSRFDRDDDLEYRRRSGIRRWDDRGDDAAWRGDLDDASVVGNDADGL